jgi:hypothetical protein
LEVLAKERELVVRLDGPEAILNAGVKRRHRAALGTFGDDDDKLDDADDESGEKQQQQQRQKQTSFKPLDSSLLMTCQWITRLTYGRLAAKP